MPCAHPLIKGFADVGTGYPQFDVVRFVDYRVLRTLASNQPTEPGREPTLIIVRRTRAEVNADLAGITPVDSFARLKALMAVFSEERVSFCPWFSVVMVRCKIAARKRWSLRTAGKNPNLTRNERQSCCRTSRGSEPVRWSELNSHYYVIMTHAKSASTRLEVLETKELVGDSQLPKLFLADLFFGPGSRQSGQCSARPVDS